MSNFTFGGYAGNENSLEGVEFWPRFAARLIDHVVHFAVTLIAVISLGIMIAIVMAATGGDFDSFVTKLQQYSFTSFFITIVGLISYHTICEGLHGSTLGKLLLGQVVLTEEQQPCGLRPALIRSLAYFVDSLFIGAVGYVAMQKTNLNQRHGDDWAKTVVCKRSQVASDKLRGAGRFMGVLALALAVDTALVMLSLLSRLL